MLLALSEINWDQFMRNDLPPVVVGICAFATLIAIVAIWHWSKVRVAEAELYLKERMIERGFSAGEIERVLATGKRHGRRSKRHRLPDAEQPI
jgi:hypothetical protein